MRQKHRRSLLSFLLIIGMLFTTVSFPEYAMAGGLDKTEAVKDTATVTFTQYRKPIDELEKLDMSKDIEVEINFTPVFNNIMQDDLRIEKGDYVEFDLGGNLKFTGDDELSNEITVPIKDADTGLKICDVIYTKDPSTGHVKAKFDFSNTDDTIFEKDSAEVRAVLTVKADVKNIDWETNTDKVITIFGKEYKVINIEGELVVTKEGKVDAKNHKVDWTITIDRFVKGTDRQQRLSLEGFRVRDLPSIDIKSGIYFGDYIRGSFEINGKAINDDTDLPSWQYAPNSRIKDYTCQQI